MKTLAFLFLSSFAVAVPHTTETSSREIPDFALTSVSGEKVSLFNRKDLLGKVWVMNFMFTHCTGPCPMNSARMEGLQKRLPEGIRLASFTVDPKNDQASELRRYAQRFHARPGRWIFITGRDEESMIPLFKDSFHTAYRASPKAPCGYETFHSPKMFLIDRKGFIRGEYLSEDPAQLATLEKDAIKLNQGA